MAFPFLQRVSTQLADYFRNALSGEGQPEIQDLARPSPTPSVAPQIRSIVGNQQREIPMTVRGPNLGEYLKEKLGNLFQQPQPLMPVPTSTPIPSPTPTPTPTPLPTPAPLARNPAVVNYNITPQVAEAINNAASRYGVPAQLLFDIALQESSFNPTLSRPEGDTGLFQFTPQTWDTVLNYLNMPRTSLSLPNTDRLDPFTSALAAAYLIGHGQLGRWNASQEVWGPYYGFGEVEPFYNQTLPRYIPQANWKK